MSEVETDNSILTDELLIVRDSGEIPEVALHGSIYYLTRSPEGPGVELDRRQIRALQGMALERYLEIIHRDLEPANRHLSIYRGLARALANWRRLAVFCRKEDWSIEDYRREVAESLRVFLHNEVAEFKIGECNSSINCGWDELQNFARELGLDPDELPENCRDLCA